MHSNRWLRRTTLAAAALLVAAAPAAAVKRRAFVTSVTGTGNLASWPDAGGQTGLAAGNQICRARANAAGLPNANAYRAWLSTSTTDAYCHVQGLNGKKATGCEGAPQPGGGPWYLVNGITSFTASLAELTGPEGIIYRPVSLDEFADEAVGETGVWTGTDDDGEATATTCDSWTSGSNGIDGTHGFSNASASLWSWGPIQVCSVERRLLCLEPGASEATTLGWSPGALAFVTSAIGHGDLSAWPQAGGATGIGAGDAICRNLAGQAHLPAPESFVAWLSDWTTDARDRLTLSDAPYRRVDGFTVANSKADLVDGAIPNSLHVTEAGSYLQGSTGVWTGSQPDGTADPDNCAEWTNSSQAEVALIGIASYARTGQWTGWGSTSCGVVSERLYCFSNIVTLFWDGFELTGDTSRWSSVVP